MRHWIHGPLAHCEDTNVVFFRGISLDVVTQGLLGLRRMPLAHGKGTDWGLLLHDMHSWDAGDYEPADYRGLCSGGGELVVFVTEPCRAKAHGPRFEYHRDGRLITRFRFETLDYRAGEEPDLLLPALTTANLVAPGARLDTDGDDDDKEERIVQAVARFFSLPELEMPPLL
ncbi:DUF6461 domain-containing protein [Streptomyces sp. NPDC005808]|uniref:DUF6461 domain-containing protein n=1 Tax=Streptomyces sp. NPDC005808 TaxID=3364734 RepID=UPI0036BA6273